MHTISRLFVILALAVAVFGPSRATHDHPVSTAVGAAADQAGASFVAGARRIARPLVEALAAGEIILGAACDVTELVVEDLAFVLIEVEQGFVFVAKQAARCGRVIVRGVVHVARKTADGIVFVAEETAHAIQNGLRWAADTALALKLRTRLAGALIAGSVSADSLACFQALSVSADASAHLRLRARAAFDASEKFTAAYQR